MFALSCLLGCLSLQLSSAQELSSYSLGKKGEKRQYPTNDYSKQTDMHTANRHDTDTNKKKSNKVREIAKK